MTNFKKVIDNLTPEALAELGVRLINVNSRELYYMTSTGQLFHTNNYEAALQHEYRWLMQDDISETNKELLRKSECGVDESQPDKNDVE